MRQGGAAFGDAGLESTRSEFLFCSLSLWTVNSYLGQGTLAPRHSDSAPNLLSGDLLSVPLHDSL